MDPIVEVLKKASPTIRKQFGLRTLGVFGSYASGKMHADSDLDILYDLEENACLSFRDLLLLEETIQRITGIKENDLVRVRQMNPLVWLTVKDSVLYV